MTDLARERVAERCLRGGMGGAGAEGAAGQAKEGGPRGGNAGNWVRGPARCHLQLDRRDSQGKVSR